SQIRLRGPSIPTPISSVGGVAKQVRARNLFVSRREKRPVFEIKLDRVIFRVMGRLTDNPVRLTCADGKTDQCVFGKDQNAAASAERCHECAVCEVALLWRQRLAP